MDKRDFGNWLHAVLQRFHEDLRDQPTDDADERSAPWTPPPKPSPASSACKGDFLPLLQAGATARWLFALAGGHEQQGAMFRQAEVKARQPLGDLELIGTIDRIDGVQHGRAHGAGD